MMTRHSSSVLTLAAIVLFSCTSGDRESNAALELSGDVGDVGDVGVAGVAGVVVDPGTEVASIADAAWDYAVERSPYLQVRSGELIRRLPDFSFAANAEAVAFSKSIRERLASLSGEELTYQDRLTAEILEWDAERVIDFEPHFWLSFPYTPYQIGFVSTYIHGQLGLHPFDEPVEHTANYLSVVAQYAGMVEQLASHVRGQVERGIYLSKPALPAVIGTFEAFAATVPAAMRVGEGRLEALSEEQRDGFLSTLDGLIADRVEPAFADFLGLLGSDEYAAAAPTTVGLAQYPGGEALYRLLVRFHTTMEVTPEALHEIGKTSLAELEAEMEAIRDELGFEGDRAAFHDKLRSDPRFFAKSAEEVEAKFQNYIDRIEPRISEYFRILPEAPYGVKRLDPAAEATMTFGFYQSPTPGEPVGRYNYNASKLDERPQIWAGPLIYHELVPGHHFHIALQNENEALPIYRRQYLSASAFNEGWGNYGAILAQEMGLLSDPYERYGAALFHAFITARLVLDTGMNLLGWSLDDARQYMREHTFQSETEIATETLRYSTDLNGQALAYRAGLEKLLELREAARERAGENFDIRDFHDAVLGSGAMPLAILEGHVEHHMATP